MALSWVTALLFVLTVPPCICQQTTNRLSISISTVNLNFDSSTSERSIQLAPGLNHTLRCSTIGGFGSSNQVWYRNNSLVPTDMSQRVYTTNMNSGDRYLVIHNLSETEEGRYSCRYGGDSRTLVVSSSNPAAIAATPVHNFSSGGQNSRPSLKVYFSADPLPISNQTGWLFNGGTTLPADTFKLDMPNIAELVLSSNIETTHAGNYTFFISTSAGTSSAVFIVNVASPPVPRLSPATNQILLLFGQNFTLSCSDRIGTPPPTLYWSFNGTMLSGGGRVSISDTSNSTLRWSRLDIMSVTKEDIGSYECRATNFPPLYFSAFIMITVLSPPLPPVNISVNATTSPCIVRITWSTISSSDSALAESYEFEIQYLSSDGSSSSPWTPLRRGTSTPLTVHIPSNGINTTYQIRGRGFNVSYGEYSAVSGEYISYRDDMFPMVDIMAAPANSSGVDVSWTIPESDCYAFMEFSVNCTSDSDSVTKEAGSSATAVRVDGLTANTIYDCTVSWRLLDRSRRTIDRRLSSSVARSFTLPDPPSVPPTTPTLDMSSVGFDGFSISVKPLSLDEEISHYQILVLRLSSDELPMEPPDTRYPNNSSFAMCKVINDANNKNAEYQPYVATEFSATNFTSSRKFLIGADEGEFGMATRCNNKLLSGVSYTVFVRAYPSTFYDQPELLARGREKRQTTMDIPQRQYNIFSSSRYLQPIKTKSVNTGGPLRPAPTDEIVKIVIPVVVVVMVIVAVSIVIILVYCYCRMRRMKSKVNFPSVDESNSKSSSVDDLVSCYSNTPDMDKRKNGTLFEMKEIEAFADPLEIPFEPSGPIPMEHFAEHVSKYDAKRQLLFQEEFEWITKKSPWHSSEASNDPRNDNKNRYSNITAFDHSRVKLKEIDGVECSDYINANYVSGYNKQKEYIATQGPLEQTVEDFWRMVWEQDSTTIIMLTNVVELGKIKCAQYWPTNNKAMYGDIAVTVEDTHIFPDYTIRTLSVQSAKTSETRRVLQFHYIKWPDYGTPKLAAPLLNFLKIVHESIDSEENSGPIVVHCSAGVGRSGTVLTIDYCLQQLRNENTMNICGFVRQMREQRSYMVQTDQQYTFIYYALLEAITYGDTSYDMDKFIQSYQRMQKETSSSSDNLLLREEFGRLGTVKTMVKKSSFQNRIKMKGAPQRHFHSSYHGGSSGSLQQCLGHLLDGYNQSRLFMVTEGPDEYTANRFWEMIWDHNCACIIMLTPMDAKENWPYWPNEEDKVLQFGTVKVMVESESAEHLYTCRRIRLTNAKVEGISHDVVQYQFMGWTAGALPKVVDFMSFVCDVLKRVDMREKNLKIMVHDTTSLGPTGIFCSLYYCIQRLQTEKTIDVFQAVQMIQLQRPGCISLMEHYFFIYDCVYEFLMKNS